MKCVIDVDGPLTDFHAKARVHILEEFGYDFPLSHFKDWDVTSVLERQEEKDRLNEIFSLPGYASSMVPLDESVRAISSLREMGANILFATSPFPDSRTWKEEREDWLIKHFGASPDEVAHIHKKDFLGGHFFVDDKPFHIRGWTRSNPGRTAFLWKTFYNEHEEGMTFAASWEDVVSAVRSWAG